jgi:hypothetical protein
MTTRETVGPKSRVHGTARDLGALLVIAVACPGALLAGALLSCAARGFDSECAMEGILRSPFILLGAGLVAGLLTRGLRGCALVLVGVLIGMVAILVVSFAAGNLVMISPVEAIIATIWFAAPVTVGYLVGRLVGRLVGGKLA